MQRVGSDDPAERARAFELLVRAYWRPVYKHVRLRHRRDATEAQDLTQGFFARALEKGYFASFDPDKARFRTFLKVCLDRFVIESARAEQRLKRGGGLERLSLDFEVAEQELQTVEGTEPEAVFDREWVRGVLGAAVDALQQHCEGHGKAIYFEVFRRYVLDDEEGVSYRQVAEAHGLSVTQVTNYLSWSRRTFRRLALEHLRELTSSEEEFRDEARALFGEDVTEAR